MKRAEHWTGLTLGAALLGGLAEAQTTERVSVDSAGAQASGASGTFAVAISADGRRLPLRLERGFGFGQVALELRSVETGVASPLVGVPISE